MPPDKNGIQTPSLEMVIWSLLITVNDFDTQVESSL